MDCPVCHVALRRMERLEVEIDHCPQCRGVWLDRGELDKIIEQSMEGREYSYEHDDDEDDHEHRDKHHGEYDDYRPRRRKSFLRDLLDF